MGSVVDGWQLSWTLNTCLLIAGCGYLVGSRRASRWPALRTACFFAGLVALVFALESGIAGNDERMLSSHMIEHGLIWSVATPLIAASAPVTVLLRLLGKGHRRAFVELLHHPVARAVAHPAVATAVFAATIAITHLPALYSAAAGNEPLHDLEHGLYFWTALLFWATMFGVDPLAARARLAGRIIGISAAMAPMVWIGAWLFAGTGPVYEVYARAHAEPAVVADQRLAGEIMLIGGGITGAALVLGLAWRALVAEERRQRVRDLQPTGDPPAARAATKALARSRR